MVLRYNRQLMTVQKTRPRTQHSGPRPRTALNFFLQPHQGVPIGGSAAFWSNSGSKYAESLPHILRAFFTEARRFLEAPWHPPLLTVLWTLTPFMQLLFQARSLWPAETTSIELSASRGRGFPGMLRHCHRACIQKFLVCGNLVRLG